MASKQPPIPVSGRRGRYGRVCSRVQVNQVGSHQYQNPGPAGPRPDTQSGPRGRAGAQLGGGGKDAADARRGGP